MNYPDDIGNYDNDPRSPFYEGGTFVCSSCGGVRDGDEMGEDVCVYCVMDE